MVSVKIALAIGSVATTVAGMIQLFHQAEAVLSTLLDIFCGMIVVPVIVYSANSDLRSYFRKIYHLQ